MNYELSIIGTVKGPGKEANQYVFITTDNRQVRIGEFVYYQGQDTAQKILGKISARALIDHLPDRLFADTETSPELIAALVGFTAANPELYEITVEMVGYFQTEMGFINPRQAPDPGAKVYLAEDHFLCQILSKKQPKTIGSAHLGRLLLRGENAVPIALDVKELVSTHMAILAGTGSGKSYTAGVLIEELMQPYNRAAVLILDPHGEYETLTHLRNHQAFAGADGYAPQVQILSPTEITIRLSSLNYYDMLTVLPPMSDRQQAILSKAFAKMEKNRKQWDVEDLIGFVYEADTIVNEDTNEPTTGSSAPALEWKLQKLQRSPYFHRFDHLPPHQLFKPGQVTVLQMNDISQEEQQLICATILRQTYQARMDTLKQQSTPGDENHLPYPVFILIEEAHRFAPAHEPSQCKQVLRTILSEGRKFGLGVGLITQRPGKLDSDVLSQCMSQFLMRIVNPVDQDSLKHGVEAAGRDLLQELPALSKGQVIIAGACVNTPVLCQVRQRLTPHGGNTLDAPKEWQGYFQPQQLHDRQLQNAPLAPRPIATTQKGRSID